MHIFHLRQFLVILIIILFNNQLPLEIELNCPKLIQVKFKKELMLLINEVLSSGVSEKNFEDVRKKFKNIGIEVQLGTYTVSNAVAYGLVIMPGDDNFISRFSKFLEEKFSSKFFLLIDDLKKISLTGVSDQANAFYLLYNDLSAPGVFFFTPLGLKIYLDSPFSITDIMRHELVHVKNYQKIQKNSAPGLFNGYLTGTNISSYKEALSFDETIAYFQSMMTLARQFNFLNNEKVTSFNTDMISRFFHKYSNLLVITKHFKGYFNTLLKNFDTKDIKYSIVKGVLKAEFTLNNVHNGLLDGSAAIIYFDKADKFNSNFNINDERIMREKLGSNIRKMNDFYNGMYKLLLKIDSKNFFKKVLDDIYNSHSLTISEEDQNLFIQDAFKREGEIKSFILKYWRM